MSRKRIFLIAAAAMTLLLVCGMGVFLHGQEEYVPQAQATQMDVERSQVFLTGEGYKLDKKQEKVHQKQEKQREEKQKEKTQDPKRIAAVNTAAAKKVRNRTAAKKSDSVKVEKSSKNGENSGNKKPTAADPEDITKPSTEEKSEEDRAKQPTIRLSVYEGEIISGKRVDFTVIVTDYKGREVPVYSEDDGGFTVTVNGAGVSSDGSNGFRAELKNGKNTIKVTAWDRENNQGTKTVTFQGDTSAQAEVIGQVYVTVAAPILHLDVIAEATVPITKGDTAKDVLDEVFRQAGITPTYKGTYLAGIGREGIAAGAWIDDEVRELMEERRQTEKDPAKQDPNTLKEHDFYDSSGWIYQVNGDFPEKSVGTYKMEEGDELYLVFQLAEEVY